MKKSVKLVVIILSILIVVILIGVITFFGFSKQSILNFNSNSFYSFSAGIPQYQSGCGNYLLDPIDMQLVNECKQPSTNVNIIGYSFNLNNCPTSVNFNGQSIGNIESNSNIISQGCIAGSTAYVDLINNVVTTTEPSNSNIKISKSSPQIGVFYAYYDLNIKNDSIDMTITPLKTHYITGENVTVNVQITNNLAPFYAKLCIKGQINTIFGLNIKESCNEQIYLGKGKTNVTFVLPISQVPTQEIELIPSLELWLDKSKFTGVIFNYASQGFDYAYNDCHLSQNYQVFYHTTKCIVKSTDSGVGQYLGNIELEPQTIVLNPKPIYLNKSGNTCPNGYEVSSDNNYCIDYQLKGLSCVNLGCPIIVGHDYQCTSSGFCAETVSIFKSCKNNTECPLETTCEVTSGLCIKNEIIHDLISCNNASECPKSCDGQLITCNQNKCEYSGNCTITTVYCSQLGCPESYTCDSTRNVCEKTIEKIVIDWRIVISIIVVSLIIIIFLISIIYILYKKKRK
jgi:hypothetical protein